MNLLAAGVRSCATAIFFIAAIVAAQSSAIPAAPEQSRKTMHRSDRHGAESVPCKGCSKDSVVAPTPAPPTGSLSTQQWDPKPYAIILEANDKNEISLAVPLGVALQLTLFVKEPPASHQPGQLSATTFISQGDQQGVLSAPTKIQLNTNPITTERTVSVDVSKQGAIPFEIHFERLRAGKTYKGQLSLAAGELINQWNVTLTTERGVLAVDSIGTLKFVKWPWQRTGMFSFTLYDKADAGPYHHLRVRFEPPSGTNSKAITSNFSVDTLLFRANGIPVDLAQRDDKNSGGNESGNTLTKARTFSACIKSLSPGEYSGALHFAADETSDDAGEAKLPLLFQVRHSVWIPVIVIFLSSLLGWFGSKFLVGLRRSRVLLRQIKSLRERADALDHPERPFDGWRFPSESTSLGFGRVIVELSVLGKLAHSAIEVVFHGDEIEARLKLAEQRLLGLESLRKTRLGAQKRADGRPAAQQAIGSRLRLATTVLDGPNFNETEQADLNKLLGEIDCWINDDNLIKAYRDILIARVSSALYPGSAEIGILSPSSAMFARLDSLIKSVPNVASIQSESDRAKLKQADQTITWVMVLWRERQRDWAEELANIDPATKPLDELFYAVDKKGWEVLKRRKSELSLNQVWPTGRTPLTYEVVEIELGFKSPSDFKLEPLRFHPSQHVQWKVVEERQANESGDPGSRPSLGSRWRNIFRSTRKIERPARTDSFTLVQYFLSAGKIKVTAKARLFWRSQTISETIDIDEPLEFHVKPNPEYGKKLRRVLKNWPDFAAIIIAALFAIATAIGAQYDSTFGSWNQYIAIIIWAAGAAAGGNLFAQLGTSSAPGGTAATTK